MLEMLKHGHFKIVTVSVLNTYPYRTLHEHFWTFLTVFFNFLHLFFEFYTIIDGSATIIR